MNCIEALVPLTIIQGGTFYKKIRWETGDPAVAVDLTGYDAKMQVRKKITDATTLLSLVLKTDPWEPDIDSGIYLEGDNIATGEFVMYITDEDTAALCPSHKDIEGVYDLFLTSADGETVLRPYGTCTIKATVTREETP